MTTHEEDRDGAGEADTATAFDDVVEHHCKVNLEEEIQSTIDGLQDNSAHLERHLAEALDAPQQVTDTSSGSTVSSSASSSTVVVASQSQAQSVDEATSAQYYCTPITPSFAPSSSASPSHPTNKHADQHLSQNHQHQQSQGEPSSQRLETEITALLANTPTAPQVPDPNRSDKVSSLLASEKASSCLAKIDECSTQSRSRSANEFGIPTFNKHRPLFSESIQHMQRWRQLNEKGKSGVIEYDNAFLGMPPSEGANVGLTWKGMERFRGDGKMSLLGSSLPLSSIKLPRPRSWVNNILSVASDSTASRQRHHSFDTPTETRSGFRGGAANLEPVSSLVLQDEFDAYSSIWSMKANENISEDEKGEQERRDHKSLRNTRTSLGALAGATQSTPNLTSSPSPNGFSVKRKAAPQLMVRNLDDAPQGVLTPLIQTAPQRIFPAAKKMTNPWMKMPSSASSSPLRERSDLIGADEEERMLDEALARETNNGTLAEEERAVLRMLDQMNDSVDTFKRPTNSRTQSRATSPTAAPRYGNGMDKSSMHSPFPSPTKLSVRAVADAIDKGSKPALTSSSVKGGGASSSAPRCVDSRSGSPVRWAEAGHSDARMGGTSSVEQSRTRGRSVIVKKAIREREELDLRPVDASASPSRGHDFLRQDSSSAGVSSYAFQTNAFLNRRPTHAAEKCLTTSPNQSSHLSSSVQGSTSTYWSRADYPLDSPGSLTSPGLPSESEDGLPFHYGKAGGPKGKTSSRPPLLRRLMTDMTGETSVVSYDEPSSPIKGVHTSVVEELVDAPTLPREDQKTAQVKSDYFQTPTKAAFQAYEDVPPTPPAKDDILPSPTKALRPALRAKLADSPDRKMSLVKLDTPKKAKDLIHFYESNSPKLASRHTTPTSLVKVQYRKDVLCSTFVNSNQIESPPASLALHGRSSVLVANQGKLGVHPMARQSMRRRDLMGTGVGTDEVIDVFCSANDDGESFPTTLEDEENTGFPSTVREVSAKKRSSTSAFKRGVKTLPLDGPISLKASLDFSQEAIDGGYESRERKKSSSSGPGKSDMIRSMTALTSSRASNGVDDARVIRGSEFPSPSRQRALPSPPPRDQEKGKDDQKRGEDAKKDDRESVLSAKSLGTTRSFRQMTENGSNLLIDTECSIGLSGQAGAKPLRTGFIFYLNVHSTKATWQRAQAVLLPSTIALSWIPAGGGRMSIVLDLVACREVHSVAGPNHTSSSEDIGAKIAKEQGLNRICPWQVVFEDGVERMAVESATDRVQWVSAISDTLGSGATQSREATVLPERMQSARSTADESNASLQRAASWARRVVPTGTVATSADSAYDRITALSAKQSLHEEIISQSSVKLVSSGKQEQQPKKKRSFVDDDGAARPSTFGRESHTTVKGSAPSSNDGFKGTATTEDDFGPRSPRSDAEFGWTSVEQEELVPSDSASQRPSWSGATHISRSTVMQKGGKEERAISTTTVLKKVGIAPDKTSAQEFRDSVISGKGADDHEKTRDLAVVVEETADSRSSAAVIVRDRALTYTTVPADGPIRIIPRKQASSKGASSYSNAYSSQAIQTPAVEDKVARNAELVAVLNAIKDNDRARQEQEKQQLQIAHYLNELNLWLEKDVVNRSKEWRTLALGVTQLHEELNAIKTGNVATGVSRGGSVAMMPTLSLAASDVIAPNLLPANSIEAEVKAETGAGAAAAAAGGPSGARRMPGGMSSFTPPTPIQPSRMEGILPAAGLGFDVMPPPPASVDAMALGVDAPAPISSPGPSTNIKRSGTRTWHAECSPAPIRNEDVWNRSGTIKETDKKKAKEVKKADGRSRRREALVTSNLGRLAAAAGGAALISAGMHEYEKYKERQRSQGKPEEGSHQMDEKTGRFEQYEEVPKAHADKIKEAVEKGDEIELREAIKKAAEVGAGTAAVQKLIQWIKGSDGGGGGGEGKGKGEEQDQDDVSTLPPSTGRPSGATATDSSRTAKSSRSSGHQTSTSVDSDITAETLQNAVKGMSVGAGGGALALAVEEILKHLLEKKEEEKKRARELIDMEAAREIAKRKEDEEREERLLLLREKEKTELVSVILARLQEEKAVQEAEMANRQKEMDPKSAIESLVTAINSQREMDAAQKASTDQIIKQMANDVLQKTADQNGRLVEAVHGAAREMLRHNVETHAEELKKVLSKEVSGMFEDVGKIREAKRALEHEIADLFSIKSRHLGGMSDMNRNGAFTVPMIQAPPLPPAAGPSAVVGKKAHQALPIPHLPRSAAGGWSQPMTQPPPPPQQQQQHLHPMPVGLGTAGGVGTQGGGQFAMPMTNASSKRDLVGPFSVSFGPRKK
ncbi:hypothetical protein CBS101457_003761 [Exobasidium rhododendri]|nr:hypothetical protein CBS101457_003761 [Exobasidium rhododendri]